jgi:hypothetical protein
MTSIQETVQQEMSRNGLSGYTAQARPVIDALVERERGISDTLIRFATEQGLTRSDASAACEEAGLAVRPVVAAPTPGGGDMGSQIEDLRSQVRSIAEALDNMTRTNR